MVFLFQEPEAWLKKGEIETIFDDKGFRKFARWLDFPLPDEKFKDMFPTNRIFGMRMTKLRDAGWLRSSEKKGPGREYSRGENWLGSKDSSCKQETDK